jgi:type IX secretion system substrate protein
MKSKFLILLFLSANTLSAQLMITPGAQFSIFSDTKLTLKNTDLINNGNFLVATTSPISFTGNVSSFIGGDQAVRFFKLEINKTGNQSVSLQKTISVGSGVFFTSGFLNLNGFDVDLETTGHLDGEREDSRVIGPNGGNVLFSTTLNNPAGSNPANLGIVITSDQNLGNVRIKRGHQAQSGAGLDNSILRYYDIISANNANLNATLNFKYFDGELNSINESLLALFKTEDGTNWSNQGFTSRNSTENSVTKTGISSFSRWTLSSGANSPLAVLFVLFNANCEDGRIILTWKTAQEQNSTHFNIERSVDGTNWLVIGNVPAAGNSAVERSYSFTDGSPAGNTLYRVAEYDVTGKVQYTTALHSSCDATDDFSLWPNPVSDKVFLHVTAGNESQANINVFDSKGALVKIERVNVLRGSNVFTVDMAPLSSGTYLISVNWDQGQMKKAVRVVKR